MGCQVSTNQAPQQPTTVLPANLPQNQGDWSRFIQRLQEMLSAIHAAGYTTGVNVVPTQYSIYDGTALPGLRLTGATSSLDTTNVQFGAASLKLVATGTQIVLTLAASGYPATMQPYWKWIASLYCRTDQASLSGTLAVTTAAGTYTDDISGAVTALAWSRLYGNYDLTADASTSCTLTLTLNTTAGATYWLEAWQLEPVQGNTALPSPFIFTSPPRTWGQLVNDGNKPANGADVTSQNTANDTAHVNGSTASAVSDGAGRAQLGFDVNGLLVNGRHSIDLLADGTTYARIYGSDLTSNRLDFSKSLLNKHLGNIPDGGGRYGVHQVDSNNLAIIDFSQAGHVNKTLDNVGDGTTYGRPLGSRLSAGKPWIDFSETIHANKKLDYMADTGSYAKTPVMGGSAIVVPNANFLAPVDATGQIPGWTSANGGVLAYFAGVLPFGNAQCLHVTFSGSSPSGFGAQSPSFKADANDTFYVKGWAYADTGGATQIIVYFFNSAGGYLGQVTAATNGYGSWQQISASGVAPSGTSQAFIRLFNTGTGGGSSYFYGIHVTRAADLSAEVAGTLSTQRNLPLVTWGNYGGGWSGLSVTYSTTTTSCTFSASAASFIGGADSIAYNSSSATVSGTAGSTVTYYLYYDDPSMTGGSKTLQTTTSQITSLNANGRVLVNKVTVTYPTSGTGSGSGNTGCPQVDEPVIRRGPDGSEEVIRAGDVREGDYLRLSSGHWGLVTYSEAKLQPGVRLHHADGNVVVSESAPMETADGVCVSAPYTKGLLIKHRALGATRILDVEQVGHVWVQHITCEDDCFWVGDLSHHNLKPG